MASRVNRQNQNQLFFFFRCEASCSDGPLCTNTFQFNLSPCHGAVTAKCGEVTEIGGETEREMNIAVDIERREWLWGGGGRY